MEGHQILLYELINEDNETVDFACTEDSGNTIILHYQGVQFEAEAYHAQKWAQENLKGTGVKLVLSALSLKRLKASNL